MLFYPHRFDCPLRWQTVWVMLCDGVAQIEQLALVVKRGAGKFEVGRCFLVVGVHEHDRLKLLGCLLLQLQCQKTT